MPPKACFPRGLCPEEFEFPSCAACNNGHSKHDTIFGFYFMLLDFNEENRTPDDHKRLQKLRDEIAKRYPDALPDPATREPIYRVGHIITSSPVAISVEAKPAVKAAMLAVGVKLAHALLSRDEAMPNLQSQVFHVRLSASATRNGRHDGLFQKDAAGL